MRELFLPLTISEPLPLPAGATPLRVGGQSMGTRWQVQCYAPAGCDAATLQSGLQQQLDAVDASMSHWREDSELMRFNHAEAGSCVTLSPAFAEVMDYALYLAGQTGGAYHPAAGRLVNRWGFGPPPYAELPPDDASIRALLAACRWRDLAWQRLPEQLTQPGGVWLDLSSIAKGYAVDRMALWLEQQGIFSYLAEAGGELRGLGIKPDQAPWWVDIEIPPPYQASYTPMRIAAHGLAVATSGNYRQYFDHHGQRYGHTLDLRTGYPLQNGVLSVSVIHERCMAADALATALLVMGPEAGMAFAAEQQIAALMLLEKPGQPGQPKQAAMLLSPLMQAMRES